jgi:hypothetical protein
MALDTLKGYLSILRESFALEKVYSFDLGTDTVYYRGNYGDEARDDSGGGYEVFRDQWTFMRDNAFTVGFFERLDRSAKLPRLPTYPPQLCQRCKNMDLLSSDFKLVFELEKPLVEPCELCNLFHRVLQSPDRTDGKPVTGLQS